MLWPGASGAKAADIELLPFDNALAGIISVALPLESVAGEEV
jgi:hypothetical protein